MSDGHQAFLFRKNEHQCPFKSYPLILSMLTVKVLIKASLIYRFGEATILEATDMNTRNGYLDCAVLYAIYLFVDQASSLYLEFTPCFIYGRKHLPGSSDSFTQVHKHVLEEISVHRL